MTRPYRVPLSKRFQVDENGCWIWNGAISDTGYGNAFYMGKMEQAHRVSYKQLVGPIPKGYVIDHLCRVPACINPAHLEVVTPQVNTLRGMSRAAIAIRTNHCQRGHEFTSANTMVYGRKRVRRACLTCWRNRARISERRLRATRAAA